MTRTHSVIRVLARAAAVLGIALDVGGANISRRLSKAKTVVADRLARIRSKAARRKEGVILNPKREADRSVAQAELRRDSARVAALGVHPKYRHASATTWRFTTPKSYEAARREWDERNPLHHFAGAV